MPLEISRSLSSALSPSLSFRPERADAFSSRSLRSERVGSRTPHCFSLPVRWMPGAFSGGTSLRSIGAAPLPVFRTPIISASRQSLRRITHLSPSDSNASTSPATLSAPTKPVNRGTHAKADSVIPSEARDLLSVTAPKMKRHTSRRPDNSATHPHHSFPAPKNQQLFHRTRTITVPPVSTNCPSYK
jgi:hypothetical protein